MKIATHPDRVYRVAREDPWSIRPPRNLNRFDISDPENPVMTLYTGESPEAALAEVLAPFRPDLEVIAAVSAIPSDDGLDPLTGVIPKSWFENRRMGVATIRPQAVIVDLTHPETIQTLRTVPSIAQKAIACGFADVDESSLKASGESGRRFTQTVAAHCYNSHYSGIRYGSRLGATYFCIAGFVSIDLLDVTDSEFLIETGPTTEILPDHPALKAVASIFGLRI